MNHSIISVQNLSYDLPDGEPLFQGLTFSLANELSALTGVNGIGKSTLVKLIAGELSPKSGVISKEISLHYLSQREVAKAVSIQEYLTWDYTYSPTSEELLGELDREALCTNLSGGEWMRVRLAKYIEDHFLILDEPTNDLDTSSKKILLHFLKRHSPGAFIITHDRDTLNICETFFELTNQGLSKFCGTYQEFLEYREEERNKLSESLEKAKRERDVLQKKIHKEKEKQNKKNQKGAKAASKGGIPKILLGGRKSNAENTTGKMASHNLKRASDAVSSVQEALSKIKTDPVMYADLIGEPIPNQKLVARAKDFNIRFNDWLYPKDLTFSWAGNIRMLIRGNNGSGKSSLIKAICGEELPTRGELVRGELRVLYLDQKSSTIDDEKTVFENVQSVFSATDSEIRNGLARFLFKNDQVFKKAKDLSGGERLRLALSKGFLAMSKPELLILDEPTNNLDLVNIDFLEGFVKEYKGALILISHDESFIRHCDIKNEFIL